MIFINLGMKLAGNLTCKILAFKFHEKELDFLGFQLVVFINLSTNPGILTLFPALLVTDDS